MKSLRKPRGIRNNNPGNVRANPRIIWKGQSGIDEDGFLKFSDSTFGIRCMAMVLRHYIEYDDIKTLHGLIARWAPSPENDVSAYVGYVAQRTGINPYVNVSLLDQGLPIILAIIWYENGECPYSNTLIEKGIHLSHIQ